ncbi:hypothetical protein Pfo_014072 [Paulownia fortunei]|nr:hypothetical protein Pfo_014072 [Paulownia fortunei]
MKLSKAYPLQSIRERTQARAEVEKLEKANHDARPTSRVSHGNDIYIYAIFRCPILVQSHCAKPCEELRTKVFQVLTHYN